MPATRTALAKDVSQENREDHPVVQHLQRQVANAFVLYANYKHYHWQTFGPLFRDLHLMFDEFAKDVLATADEFAERVRMIGQDVQNVQLRQMQEAASVQSASANQSMREAIEEADANLLVVIKEMREAAKCCRRKQRSRYSRFVFEGRSNSRKARMVFARHSEEEGRFGSLSPNGISPKVVVGGSLEEAASR